MRRVPPLLTAVLAGIWLLLSAEPSVAQAAFGTLLAVALMRTASELRPVHPRLGRLHLFVPLVSTVLVDIVRSNLGVARVVLRLVRDREVRSDFLDIPLELTDPHALAILAVIVTSTPGTSWAGVSPGRTLTLHVLDVQDESKLIRLIKQRYEQPLKRIFEGTQSSMARCGSRRFASCSRCSMPPLGCSLDPPLRIGHSPSIRFMSTAC
jgi:multicomponent K+:H+ antiporter subunit E